MKQEQIEKTRNFAKMFFRSNQNQQDVVNSARLCGKVCDKIEYHHRQDETKFYKTQIETKRLSENRDFIPVIFPEEFLTIFSQKGKLIKIQGEIRTKNHINAEPGRKLEVYIHVTMASIEKAKESLVNYIYVDGTICKEPRYRETPFGRRITEVLIAVNYNGYSSYVPCIAWDNTADYMATLKIGDQVDLLGRFQSRVYYKNNICQTAYELSIIWLNNKFANNIEKTS